MRNDVRIATLNGTLCSICTSLTVGDILQTIILAIVGTLVSYTVSRILSGNSKHKQ